MTYNMKTITGKLVGCQTFKNLMFGVPLMLLYQKEKNAMTTSFNKLQMKCTALKNKTQK